MAQLEVLVDEELVRSLLVEQHPDLAHLDLVRLDAGWDNAVWRLGTELGVRLPRRPNAAALTENELRWLPQLAVRLPLPVPVAIRAGAPGCGYPWPWSIVAWLDGEPGDRQPITDPTSAIVLARFLRALHQPAPAQAPHNPSRGSASLTDLRAEFERHLDEVSDQFDTEHLLRIWNAATSAHPWSAPPVWLHADLHPANVMVINGSLTAVIDFGDICGGDPANDLAAAWTLLPASMMSTFMDSYGDIDEPTLTKGCRVGASSRSRADLHRPRRAARRARRQVNMAARRHRHGPSIARHRATDVIPAPNPQPCATPASRP